MTIEGLISQRLRLPSPPAIAVKILEAVKQDNVSMGQLADIIASDPALTARLLKIANSSMYSLRYPVASIDKALTVLGVNVLKNIALSFVISEELRGCGEEGFDIDYFWRRAVTMAVAAELVAKFVGQPNDEAFVTGLVADIGILLLQRDDPVVYRELLDEHCRRDVPVSVVEKERFGFDHAELTATLLANWGLPDKVTVPVRFHHAPAEVQGKWQDTVEVVHLADQLSAIYHGSDMGRKVSELQALMTSRFGLSQPAVTMLVDSVAEKAREVFASFDLEPGEMMPYSQMLEEANEELREMNLSCEQLVMELKQARERSERLAGELRQTNTRLRELVLRDGLTGLYNHRYFQEMVDHEIERVRRYGGCFSLLMFDLDHFKAVNDRFGHPVGDLVLKNIAEATVAAVRASDIVARYGGEEFAVILPHADSAGLRVFAERLRRTIESLATEIGGEKIRVTVSLGGTVFEAGSSHLEKLTVIDTADRALYQSKALGRNRVTIFPLEGSRRNGTEH
ncbi:diguanylate cyclase (GGDEF)-like protein [Geothermobacter ehrlichii]|uniref:diguanylate cyclase n=1 Tax=Geothermobacter ehrlichii TaxID=213224 RepID=A0A5D3WJK6_9BACT|nr:GGDEF domain-containing protein [Geothermobacter ehrlichii]TYO98481.1 diguanylate cyclase (GGDEF)-like protein [Geothermobacter ehrlichii]